MNLSPERQRKRDLLVEAAAQVFARQGYVATTVAEIAREAEVGKGTVYEYFSSKEEILFAVFEGFNRRAFQGLEEILATDCPVREQLEEMFELGIELNCIESDSHTLSLEAWTASRGSRMEERFTAFAAQSYRLFREAIAGVIRRGQESGELRRDLEAEEAATILIAFMEGLGVQSYFDPTVQYADSIRNFSRLFLDGLTTDTDTATRPPSNS